MTTTGFPERSAISASPQPPSESASASAFVKIDEFNADTSITFVGFCLVFGLAFISSGGADDMCRAHRRLFRREMHEIWLTKMTPRRVSESPARNHW